MIKLDFSKEWVYDSEIRCSMIIKPLGFEFRIRPLNREFLITFWMPEKNGGQEKRPTLAEARYWCEEQAIARLEAVLEFIEERKLR